MIRAITTMLLATALFAAPRAGHAETIQDAYAVGLSTYYAGHYGDAIKRFERLVALPPHNEELFYNLGCAYYRHGKIGPAIFNFERALAFDPGFEDARYNLKTARAVAKTKVKDVLKGVASEAWWVSWSRLLSQRGWWILFLVLWWSALGLFFGLRYVKPGPARAALIATNSLLALLTLIAATLLAAHLYARRGLHEGIILPDRVAIREGPDASARSTFKVHAGLKVRLKTESAGWVRIRLVNGLEGWIPRTDVGVLDL